MASKCKRIAIIGAGIAGLRCASILADHHEVEVFEACRENSLSRPSQMQGALFYLDNIPDLEPTHKISKLILSSENESMTFNGDLGYLYKIGGLDGQDVKLRNSMDKNFKIFYSTKIQQLDMLKDYDAIVAADGYKSQVALMAGMRENRAECNGIGLGLTVKGDFHVGETFSLFDNYYAPGGYLYLIPHTSSIASLVSASIGSGINTHQIKERLRQYARSKDLEIIKEWVDIEKWYRIKRYQKDNIYIIGSAASLNEKTFGFGLKYSILSAEICAKAILNGIDYEKLLKGVLSELRYWKTIAKGFVNTSNSEKDSFIRLTNNQFIKKRIESGKTLRPMFKILARYYTTKHDILGSQGENGFYRNTRTHHSGPIALPNSLV